MEYRLRSGVLNVSGYLIVCQATKPSRVYIYNTPYIYVIYTQRSLCKLQYSDNADASNDFPAFRGPFSALLQDAQGCFIFIHTHCSTCLQFLGAAGLRWVLFHLPSFFGSCWFAMDLGELLRLYKIYDSPVFIFSWRSKGLRVSTVSLNFFLLIIFKS